MTQEYKTLADFAAALNADRPRPYTYSPDTIAHAERISLLLPDPLEVAAAIYDAALGCEGTGMCAKCEDATLAAQEARNEECEAEGLTEDDYPDYIDGTDFLDECEEPMHWLDLRLKLRRNSFLLNTGSPDYDQDGRGPCGCGSIDLRDMTPLDAWQAACEIIDDALEQFDPDMTSEDVAE